MNPPFAVIREFIEGRLVVSVLPPGDAVPAGGLLLGSGVDFEQAFRLAAEEAAWPSIRVEVPA